MSAPGQRRTTVSVAVAFLASVVGSAAFATAYWFDGSPQLLGLGLAMALAGVGVGLVLWSKHLMPQGPAEEAREPLSPSPGDERKTAEAFIGGAAAVGRRGLLGGLLTTAVAALGFVALWPVRSLGPRPQSARRTTGWGPGARVVDNAGRPVAVGDLSIGGALAVFPEGRTDEADGQVMLLRLDEAVLRPPSGREDWSPGGNIAYSRVCTHAGCPVGMYQPNAQVLLCPCHQATFDVVNAGEPVFGPGPRRLPQLPLDVDDDGFLVARNDFPEPVGPGRWRLG